MYAPDKKERGKLETYPATPTDLAFADQFVQWNKLTLGITRVVACRLKNGSLRLVELDELNPVCLYRLFLPLHSRSEWGHFIQLLKAMLS